MENSRESRRNNIGREMPEMQRHPSHTTMSTSISEHARQEEAPEWAVEAAGKICIGIGQRDHKAGLSVLGMQYSIADAIQQAVDSATAAKEEIHKACMDAARDQYDSLARITAAKEREFLQYCAQLEQDKLDLLAQWKQQDEAKEREIEGLKQRVEVELTRGEGWCRKFIAMRKERDALQARVRELESYETNYHSLQVRLTELENQLIQKFKP